MQSCVWYHACVLLKLICFCLEFKQFLMCPKNLGVLTDSFSPSYMIFLLCQNANDLIPRVYKKQHCNIRSPQSKILEWSVKTLGRKCKLIGLCIYLNITSVASKTGYSSILMRFSGHNNYSQFRFSLSRK